MSTNKAEYDRSYYARMTPERKRQKIETQALRRSVIRGIVLEFKRGKSCGCGESHPACLEFHHRGGKEINVSDAVNRGWSLERLNAEIAKCDLLCANCHRKMHFDEGGASIQ